MTSPNQPGQQKQSLQVDVRHVIDYESEKYAAMIQQLIRENSVLNVALRDREAENEELRARVVALGGRSMVPGAAPLVGVARPPATTSAESSPVPTPAVMASKSE